MCRSVAICGSNSLDYGQLARWLLYGYCVDICLAVAGLLHTGRLWSGA